MRIGIATFAMLAAALMAGDAAAQTAPVRGQLSFEAPGEAVRPAELTQQKPGDAVGQAHHFGYYYRACHNYYRWYFDRWYGWQRVYVGTRCF